MAIRVRKSLEGEDLGREKQLSNSRSNLHNVKRDEQRFSSKELSTRRS